MSPVVEIRVPDVGEADQVEVVEILVAAGARVERDAGLLTLESEKASMDVPSPAAGVVREIFVEAGNRVAEGDRLVSIDSEAAAVPDSRAPAEADKPAVSPSADAARAAVRPAAADPASVIDTEVAVLGAGPGGYAAAFRAADLGKRVVLVERYPTLGGVCLNVGCIPSKALLHVARVVDEAKALSGHGVEFSPPRVDLDALRIWKDSVVTRLTAGLEQLAKKRRVEVVRGTARFATPNTLLVEREGSAVTVRFEQAIVAAGSRNVELPGIPHDDMRVMDSTGALELTEIPKRLLVVGGGIIGLEMATLYGALGAKVTVVEMMDGLMPGCDRDLVRPLERRLKKVHDAEVLVATRVVEIKPQKRGLKAFFDGEKAPTSATYDRVLVAVGRRPNSDTIGVEAAGLVADENGFLPVDSQQRTNVPHIFAIGDIVGTPMLAHKATHEGKVAAEVAAGGKSALDARVIPSVAYTDPEVAWVGLTETQAKAAGTSYEVGRFPWAASGRALGIGRDEGLTKLLFDPETERVLGAGIVGPNAGDLIAEAALAIEMDCEAADLALTVHPHPTLSETIAFAAEAFEGTITDLYLPRKRQG